MIMFLSKGTRPTTWQTAAAANQRSSVRALPTNRSAMLFHRSSQPFILQQCRQCGALCSQIVMQWFIIYFESRCGRIIQETTRKT